MEKLNWNSTCHDVRVAFKATNNTFANCTAIVTGSSSGIGQETAKHLSYLGATVVLACRNMKKTEEKIAMIRADKTKDKYGLKESDLTLVPLELDLASLASVQAFAKNFVSKVQRKELPKLRLLVLNAGVWHFDLQHFTKDGFESSFGTNYLGHFLLTKLLLQSESVLSSSLRVVVLGSLLHFGPLLTNQIGSEDALLSDVVRQQAAPVKPRTGSSFFSSYDGLKAYGSSKLCNVLFARHLALSSSYRGKLTAFSLNPGNGVSTRILRENALWDFLLTYVWSWVNKSVDQGASTSFTCCLMSDEEARAKGLSGSYFNHCQKAEESKLVTEANGDVLWKLSEELVEKYL